MNEPNHKPHEDGPHQDGSHQEGVQIDELDAGMDKVIREYFDSGGLRVGGPRVARQMAVDTGAQEPAFILPRLVGRYPVTELIGHGGLGMVLRATDPELGREIAIKVIRPKHRGDDEIIASFLTEARVTSQLQHPGIVPIHEVGRTADGLPFFTMKVVEGDTLALLLRRRQMPQEERLRFLRLFAQVCHAVAFAHNAGVVHRDLKPGNVMVGQFGEVQVLDWGFAVAKRAPCGDESSDQPVSVGEPRPGSDSDWFRVLGTPAYMAPEQARGNLDAIDARTDVFALGATLTEILTGTPPYLAETREEVYLKATKGWQQDACERLANCSADEALVALARQCLSPAKEERPANAAAVAAGIERYLTGLDQKNHELQIQAAEARAYAKDEHRRRRLTLGMAIAVGAALLAAASFWWIRTQAENSLTAAISRARVFVEQAEAGSPEDAARWQAAEAAVEQAATFARGDWGSHPQLAELLAQVSTGDAEARRDRAFLDWVSGERLQLAYDLSVDSEGLDAEYTKAFAQWGVDVVTLDVDSAAAMIRDSRIAIHLVNGLDRLVEFLRLGGKPTEAADGSTITTASTATPKPTPTATPTATMGLARKLTAIAIAADRDPWRNRVRQASLDDDLLTLQSLSQAHEIEHAPRASLDLLARSLRVQGDQQTAIAVLRVAVQRWPLDYQIVHSLELCMQRVSAPPREVLWLSLLGVSSRPDSAHAWHHLANAFHATGNKELASQAFQRMGELGPNYPAAASVLTLQRGRQMLDQGYLAAAARVFEQLFVSEPHNDSALFFHALAMITLQDADAAMRSLRSALAIRETAQRRCNLGLALRMSGQFEEALRELRRGDELGRQGLDWAYPSDVWIDHVASLAARATLLDSIDESKLTGSAESRADLAVVALLRGRPSTALRLFRAAFAFEPGLRARGPEHFAGSFGEFAATAAVQAATGRDGEAVGWSPAERAEALKQALAWLNDELKALVAEAVEQDSRVGLREALSRFLHGSALAPMRPSEGMMDQVTAAEAAAWRAFWSRCERMLGP